MPPVITHQTEIAEPESHKGANPNRGSNQSGMRDRNERLVLTLVRKHKALAKSDIARITGLSPQTISVIMRSLESEGLLMRGEPIRGKVGQPSVPMSLAANGAFFFGLKVGRRSSEMVLVDFEGKVRGREQQRYAYPTPNTITAFAKAASETLSLQLNPDHRKRIAGMGVATPFELWNWAEFIGAPKDEMNLWRNFNFKAELSRACGCDVLVENDATAACGAELVFGTDAPRDFLHIYLGFFVGGGLVLNGSLFTGRSGSAGALGPMPVPAKGGGTQQLLEVASIATLERRIVESGGDGLLLWDPSLRWEVDPTLLKAWVDEVGSALAFAIVSAASVIDLEKYLIDGWMPTQIRTKLVAATQAGIKEIDTTGLTVPDVQAGTVGPEARSLGAASLPLSARFLLDQNAP